MILVIIMLLHAIAMIIYILYVPVKIYSFIALHYYAQLRKTITDFQSSTWHITRGE